MNKEDFSFFSVKSLKQFVKFGVVGISNTLVSYIVYVALVYLGLNYLISSMAGFALSVLNAFYWNNKYVFTRKGQPNRIALIPFLKCVLSYGITGLVLQNILLYVLVARLGVSKFLAPLVILTLTVPLNYILNRYWAFGIEIKGNINEKN
jgi:putative flippase GtrA